MSGEIQTLKFPYDQQLTINIIKLTLKKKGFIIHIFKSEEEKEHDIDLRSQSSRDIDLRSQSSSDIDSELSDDTVLKDNDILNIFYTREEFTQEEVKKFENKLKSRMIFFPEFKDIIIKNKAIIAGGSVLSIFGDYKINDLDIYVNYSQAKELLKDLYILGCTNMNSHQAPAYDQSFFRKNNIIARFFTVMDANVFYRNQHRNSRHNNRLSIDIMIIPDHIPLETVVTNFDLTFCQVWWDGEKIHSYDIDDIRSKSGYLNPDYIQSYLDMNIFIIRRLHKYKNRGFEIKIDVSGLQENILKKTEKTFESEIWSVSSIIKYMTELIGKWDRFDIQPQKMTLSSLYEVIDKNVVDAYILIFYIERCSHYPEKYRLAYREVFSNIIESISQQDSLLIIREWNTRKQRVHNSYSSYLQSLRQEFRLINHKRIDDAIRIIHPLAVQAEH